MGLTKQLDFRPGVVLDETELAARPHWTDGDRIRFVRKRVQKIGGWTKYVSTLFQGACRGLYSWLTAAGTPHLALGTNLKLYAVAGDLIDALVWATYDITPIRDSGTLGTDPFTTTSGSATVVVDDAAHGAAVNDFVTFGGATAVGGITIDGEYQITRIIDSGSYEVEHGSAATSSASGGGAAVTYEYQINTGGESALIGQGYGVGTYGTGTYGTARSSFISTPPRTWSLDKFGQNLLAMPYGGDLYKWTLSVGTRAAIVSGAPTGNNAFFVTAEEHIVVLGAGGDGMLAEWCDQGDDTVWTPDSTNTAGSRTLVGGSQLLAGIATEDENLIFADASVWTMTFIGGLDVFGFQQKAGGAAGIIGPKAAVDVDGVVYWMGRADFFFFDGAVRRIPNSKDIRRFVFDALRPLQAHKIYARHLSAFSEIWWFIMRDDDEITGYIKYNYDDRTWDAGTVARTAMLDKEVYDAVLMTGIDKQLYQHETGTDADGEPMNEYVKSSPFDIDQMGRWVDINNAFPDFKNLAGAIELTLLTREYPQSQEITEEVHIVTADTPVLDCRAAGRLGSFKIGSRTTDADWRFGTIHFDVSRAGER